MELSLIPNQKRLTFYIERLIYGVVIAMPLQPMVGDVLLWFCLLYTSPSPRDRG